ncbi:LysR family transcriptional regulator [Vibrio nomapromontoriensis]|uniref:LysR family transcriptional regulator n=1 Tax=Vibrio nomapromontoriensis TaxID=2910246 RepID=UPI003D0C7817
MLNKDLPLIETRLLNCFVAIAETGSLHKASIRIGKSKSTLSRWLAEFEDLLGYEVFDRKSSGLVIEINKQGVALLPNAKSVLASVHRFSAHASSINVADVPISINLAFNQFIEHECMAEIIVHLKKKYPETEINVASDLSSQAQQLLQDGSIDFVLVPVPELVHPDIGGIGVGSEQMMLVAANEHALASSINVNFQSLLSHTVLIPSHLQNNTDKRHLLPLDTISTPNFDLSVHCARKGAGIAYVPEYTARPHLLNGDICQLNTNWEEFSQVIPLMLMFRLNYPYQEIKNDLVHILRSWFGYQES